MHCMDDGAKMKLVSGKASGDACYECPDCGGHFSYCKEDGSTAKEEGSECEECGKYLDDDEDDNEDEEE